MTPREATVRRIADKGRLVFAQMQEEAAFRNLEEARRRHVEACDLVFQASLDLQIALREEALARWQNRHP